MNIVFVTSNYHPHIGGVEKHLKKLNQKLVADGHKITVFVRKFEKNYKDREVIEGVEIIRLRKKPEEAATLIGKVFNKLLTQLYLTLIFFRHINKFSRADVIHFHDVLFEWLPLPFVLFKLLLKKVYITFHGWEGIFPPTKAAIKARKVAEKVSNGNICIGHFIEKWYNTKATILSYGAVDAEKTPPALGNNAIVFLGRLSCDSGVFNYIKAWKIINEKHRDLRFIVLGDGDLRGEIEDYISKNNLSNIELTGFVENPEYFVGQGNIIFVTGYLGILEAFSLKKSVISIYDNQLKKDYLNLMPGSNEMLWIVKSTEDIISAVEEALIDKSKAEKGFLFAKENSWDKLKGDYYSLWKWK